MDDVNASRRDQPLDLRHRIAVLLARQGAAPPPAEIARFADHIHQSLRTQHWWERQLAAPEHLARMDIIRWMAVARDAGDADEALWRGYLAGHFGRPSADPHKPAQVESAGRFLCGFDSEPYWTWQRMTAEFDTLPFWLVRHRNALATLQFGNHRKYEAKQPDKLFAVIESFLVWVRRHGGCPSAAFACTAPCTPNEQFRRLYPQLKRLRRFGRTAAFDLLVFLGQMKIVAVAPDACCLAGATGPRAGARRLWGTTRPVQQLERLAVELATDLQVSPDIIEDALCNWSKKPKPRGEPQYIQFPAG